MKLHRRIKITLLCMIAINVLAGCSLDKEETPKEVLETVEETSELSEMDPMNDSENENTLEDIPVEDILEQSEVQSDNVPALSEFGIWPVDFVPEGWKLIDDVTLDYNEDGIEDHVGVLEYQQRLDENEESPWMPRILFAVCSETTEKYRLDFQDVNLIRTRDEGGIYGDPYEPLTTQGQSFTTHSYGGSAWRWAENFTYTYQEGTWYLTKAETISGYGSYATDYSVDDYIIGIGTRYKRSSEFDDMEEDGAEVENDLIANGTGAVGWFTMSWYDLAYEIPLDEAPTINEAGMRWWLAPDRVTEWPVTSVTVVDGVELEIDKVKLPQSTSSYADENYLLYTFFNEDRSREYFALYDRKRQMVSVVAEEDKEVENQVIYKDKIYYESEIMAQVTIGEEEPIEDCVGIQLCRMNLDGTGKETMFEYRILEEGQDFSEERLPYLGLIWEISGDAIVAEIYIGNGNPHPFYQMNLDGSEVELLGYVPKMEMKEK